MTLMSFLKFQDDDLFSHISVSKKVRKTTNCEVMNFAR